MFTPDYYLDLRWLNKVSGRLPLFKEVPGRNNYACRCVFCGDSEKRKRVTRLFFYTKKDSLNFECKNCGESGSFYSYMKKQEPGLFDEYKKEQMLSYFNKYGKFKRTSPIKKKVENETKPETKILLKTCVNILDLEKDHEARKYLESRKLNKDEMARLMFSENFFETAKEVAPDKEFSDKFPTDSRIVIPFIDEKENVFMIQGRSLEKNAFLRYMTIKRDDDDNKVFGLDSIDKSKTVYCVEGPMDSLFIKNCLAACDSSLTKVKEADVFVWDNQPRSKDIIELIEKAIDEGREVVIWNTSPDKKVDINDMIMDGMSRSDLNKLLKERTFKGLKAKLEFRRWRKV